MGLMRLREFLAAIFHKRPAIEADRVKTAAR
jgi:hypothetical protein